MKVSIVTAILNSPEVVRRQLLHYNSLNLSDDVEVVYVDDGSDYPLKLAIGGMALNFNFTLLETGDKRSWTQPMARNIGAKHANGKYLICTDIDHIVTHEVIEEAKNPRAHVVRFKREVAVLNNLGEFTQRMKVLRRYGFNRKRKKIAPHGNSYIINRELYLKLGGVDTRYVGTGKYPNREEVPLKRKLKKLREAGIITVLEDQTKPTIYMIPNGKYCGERDYNPFGLFHSLSRERNIGRLTNKQKRGRITNKQKRRNMERKKEN